MSLSPLQTVVVVLRDANSTPAAATIFKQNLLADQRDNLFKVIPFVIMGFKKKQLH